MRRTSSVVRLVAATGAAALLVAAVVIALALILGADENDGSEATVPSEEDVDVLHVHGLGVNPGDETLYAATHTGVFRVTRSGEAQRVANRFQDTMGFTVIGPDHFLASGHPDLREGGPPLLGLIESTDAAETWQRRSLHGEADLHAIVAAHDRVYAADATGSRLLVSTDGGATWDERGTVELAGLAVDPGEPDHLLGVTYDATVVTSRDGGRTWSQVPSPPLVALGWDAGTGLFGLAADGTLYSIDDGAGMFEPVGVLPAAGQALLVADDALYAATEGGGIFVSEDAGGTWRSLLEPRPA